MATPYGIDMGNVMAGWREDDEASRRTERFNYLKSQDQKRDQEEELIRTAARDAFNPETGAYDPAAHIANLERAGYPEVAQKFRADQQQNLARSMALFDRALGFADETNWPKAREMLASTGLAAQHIPEQFDRQWLEKARARLQETADRFGPMEPVYQDQGQVLVGQKNLDTGEYANLRDMSPPMARSSGGGGGGGRSQMGAKANQQIAYLIEQGYSAEDAANLVYRNFTRPNDPGAEYGRNWRAGMRTLFNPETSADAARFATDAAALRTDDAKIKPQGSPPPRSNTPPLESLKEGIIITYRNGQVWTRKDGKPVRLK